MVHWESSEEETIRNRPTDGSMLRLEVEVVGTVSYAFSLER